MLCSRCKKRPAVVFVAPNDKNSQAEGLCLVCAKELGIKPVSNFMDKMGISEEELDLMKEQFEEIMGSNMEDLGIDSNDLDEDAIKGGAATFPFLNALFPGITSNNEESKTKDEKTNKKADKKKSKKRKNIESYCTNLTQKAYEGKLDKIIGREKEIGRVIQILSRRTKNNPCLIGEPGVGKTAIAEGLAMRIVEGNVPSRLKEKEIQLLDLTALIAGTQFRGQFESRIKGLISEVKEAGNILLFIDEVHNLVGSGDAESSMSAANILKPALSRGEIQVIGATTFNEYRKYIEKDSALERRFQPVTIVEPSIKETINVLKGIKTYYEKYHKVKMTDELINRTVLLSERYITDRFLPDKAIDLLDEACVCAALKNVKIDEYDNLQKEIHELKIKEEKLTAEGSEADYQKLAEIRCVIAKLEESEKALLKDNWNNNVTEDDVAHVLELWTRIPASKIQENQLKKLKDIEKKLKEKIIGQDEAVELLSSAIRRNRVQINPRRKPASFIFVGPTGVGKTELVKVLAGELFDTPETLIRLDMSEFMEKHSVSKIIGSPPGYVGYEESGQVTEKVRRRPYSVLLFDEIEKAHPDVLNILLQILDEGKITDSHGRTVNFENTIIVMTSNAGSDKKDGALGFAKSSINLTKEKVMKSLSEFLRPEFLSRIDEIVIFKNLEEDHLKKIAKLILNEYVETLNERKILLTFNDDVVCYLAKKSVGKQNGARDLRTVIRREVEDKIATAIIENQDNNINKIEVLLENNSIVIKTLKNN